MTRARAKFLRDGLGRKILPGRRPGLVGVGTTGWCHRADRGRATSGDDRAGARRCRRALGGWRWSDVAAIIDCSEQRADHEDRPYRGAC
jgi:hypothetical protein